MLTHRGGERVRGGFYWNPTTWSVSVLSGEAGVLPGSKEHRFVKVSAVLLLLLAPVMGGLYVMFLPFIGFVLVARLAVEKLGVTIARTVVTGHERAAEAKHVR